MSDLFVTPWSVAGLALLSMGFPKQDYWSGLPFLSPRDLSNSGIESASSSSPALAGVSVCVCVCVCVYTERLNDFKELTYIIVEAGKSKIDEVNHEPRDPGKNRCYCLLAEFDLSLGKISVFLKIFK